MIESWPQMPSWLAMAGPTQTAAAVAALLLGCVLADWISRRLLLRLAAAVVRMTPVRWDDVLLERGVVARLAHAVPALLLYAGLAWLPGLSEFWLTLLRKLALLWLLFALADAVGRLLAGLNIVYQRADAERARQRPIKGFVQLLQLLVWLVAAVLMIAVVIERSPLWLLSGLGALTAVALLVFKDTLLSLVASIQLSSQELLRLGDWIEMPPLGADGDVIDIALHTVKVQNWDKSIVVIPTWRLISDGFKNWRGMQESGGRRIKRALLLDQRSVRFLRDDERGRLGRFALLGDYLQRKKDELKRWNESLREAALEPVNTRRLTNLGTFRAYVDAYLRSHPGIHPEHTCLVRQLPPGPTGLPIEIYCFTRSTDWDVHEAVVADIFDHLLAILPEFDLQLFQSPGAADLRAWLKAAG